MLRMNECRRRVTPMVSPAVVARIGAHAQTHSMSSMVRRQCLLGTVWGRKKNLLFSSVVSLFLSVLSMTMPVDVSPQRWTIKIRLTIGREQPDTWEQKIVTREQMRRSFSSEKHYVPDCLAPFAGRLCGKSEPSLRKNGSGFPQERLRLCAQSVPGFPLGCWRQLGNAAEMSFWKILFPLSLVLVLVIYWL